MAPTTRSGQAEEKTSEKEKSSAKGAKRTASIAGLFERATQQRQKKNEQSITATDVGSLFPHQKRHKDTTTENNPDYQKFAAAVNEYRKVAPDSKVTESEQVYDMLLNRLEGVDINGKPLGIPGTPIQLQKDLAKIKAQTSKLAKPLGEITCPAEVRRKDGTVVIENVPIATTMNNFDVKVAKRQKLLLDLKQQLEGLKKEIAAAMDDIKNDRDGATAAAMKSFKSQMEGLKKKTQEEKKTSLGEIKDAQKEDHAHAKERTAKIQQFLQAL